MLTFFLSLKRLKCCYDSVDEMVKVALAVLADTIILMRVIEGWGSCPFCSPAAAP